MNITLRPSGCVNQGEVSIHDAKYLVIVLLNHLPNAQLAASVAIKLASESSIHDATKDCNSIVITRLLESGTDVDTNDAVSRCIATKHLLNDFVRVFPVPSKRDHGLDVCCNPLSCQDHELAVREGRQRRLRDRAMKRCGRLGIHYSQDEAHVRTSSRMHARPSSLLQSKGTPRSRACSSKRGANVDAVTEVKKRGESGGEGSTRVTFTLTQDLTPALGRIRDIDHCRQWPTQLLEWGANIDAAIEAKKRGERGREVWEGG